MLVVGDKEMEQGAVALRLRSGENPGPMLLEAFLQRANEEIEKGV
jgi:threonyl-tRNA synthetase